MGLYLRFTWICVTPLVQALCPAARHPEPAHYGGGTGGAAPTATAYSVTLSSAQSRNSAVWAQAVSAGDVIAIRHTDVGSPTAAICLVSIIID